MSRVIRQTSSIGSSIGSSPSLRAGALAASIAFAGTASQAPATIVIDNFQTEQTLLLSATGGEPVSGSNTRLGPIAGTAASERSIFVAVESPSDPTRLATGSLAMGRGILSYALRSTGAFDPGGAAFMQTTWRYNGGINLTAGGLNRFSVQSTTLGPGLQLTLSVIDLVGRDASFAFAPGGTTEIAFTAPGWVLGSAAVNFAAIQTISLNWTSTGEGTSATVPVHADLSSFRVVPTPGAISLLALSAWAGLRRRRRIR